MLKALTGLRFFLALYVVFFHNLSFFAGIPFLYLFISKGYCAVSVFFLLSGFILAYRYESLTSRKELLNYGVSRIARIYPLYAIALLIELPLSIYFIYRTYSDQWIIKSFTVFLTNAFMIQAWNENWLGLLNGPGWSLSVEVLFYILFPVVFFLLLRIRKHYTLIGIIAIIYLAIVMEIPATCTQNLYDLLNIPVNIDAQPFVHLPVFTVGVALGVLYKKSAQLLSFIENGKNSFYLVSLSLLGLIITLISGVVDSHNINNGLLIPFFATLILGLTDRQNFITKVLSRPIFLLLGNASYGIYILQIPIRRWATLLFEKTGLLVIIGGELFLVIYFSFLIVVSVLLYHYFEKPINIRIRSWLRIEDTKPIKPSYDKCN